MAHNTGSVGNSRMSSSQRYEKSFISLRVVVKTRARLNLYNLQMLLFGKARLDAVASMRAGGGAFVFFWGRVEVPRCAV